MAKLVSRPYDEQEQKLVAPPPIEAADNMPVGVNLAGMIIVLLLLAGAGLLLYGAFHGSHATPH